MKRTLLCFAACFLALCALAKDPQIRPQDVVVAPAAIEKGHSLFFKGNNLGRVVEPGDAAMMLDALTTPVGKAKMARESFVEKAAHVDDLGLRHVRVNQQLNGLDVIGAQIVVHSNANGDVYAINGKLAKTTDTDANPKLGAKEALDRGMRMANILDGRLKSRPELTYVMNDDGIAVLSWSAKIAYTNNEGPQEDIFFVEANTASEFTRHPQFHYVKNRRTYHGNYGSSLPGTLRRSEGQGAIGDTALDAAHDNAGKTYDFYQSVFGRDSYDNAGATMNSTVHHQRNYNNAFWNGSQMVYGDGDGSQFGPLSQSLDVVAHELTHAVTERSSGLIYRNESGALNEAMSDIMGAACTIHFDGGINSNSWLLGEEVYTPGTPGDALRYMDNPTRDGRSYDYYPERYTGSSDNGGVHINSGIANLAFVLLCQGGTHPRGKTNVNVPTIGVSKAQAIFYRANNNYLTANSNFEAARNATAQAAEDLYGATEKAAVHKAWDAVGVPGGGGTDPTDPTDPTCNGTTYSGTLYSGSEAYQPNGTYFYANYGQHVGVLAGPAGTDFDLYLWRWNGSWVTVAQGTTPQSSESVNYSGSAGYYVWRIHAYSGSGNYSVCIDQP